VLVRTEGKCLVCLFVHTLRHNDVTTHRIGSNRLGNLILWLVDFLARGTWRRRSSCSKCLVHVALKVLNRETRHNQGWVALGRFARCSICSLLRRLGRATELLDNLCSCVLQVVVSCLPLLCVQRNTASTPVMNKRELATAAICSEMCVRVCACLFVCVCVCVCVYVCVCVREREGV
jgi:hypothetical protein